MNSLAVSLALMVALVYATSASPCTDICNGECALARQACELPGIFGDLCETSFNICSQSCAAACNCVDTCAQQCGAPFAECRGDGTNPLNLLSCGLNLSICTATCQTQCGFSTFAAIVNAVTGGVMAVPASK